MHGSDGRDERRSLLLAITDLARLLFSREHEHAATQARELADRVADLRFNVVVVGAFKRGKTTLVNALLGAEYLPAAVVPLTSVVTIATSGPEAAAEIAFGDGRREAVAIDRLPRFVTEPGNPGNGLGVSRALVRVPASGLPAGVSLIDTPGIGSVYRHNSDVTREILAEADAAIFVTTADPPVSDEELGFLHQVRASAARMFVVMNKVDHLLPEEREQAGAFTRRVVGEALEQEVDLYQVSARVALDALGSADTSSLEASGLPGFASELATFLARDRFETLAVSARNRAAGLVTDEMNAIASEERALDMTSEELTGRTRELERVFEEARRARDDLGALLERDAHHTIAVVEADLEDLKLEATGELLAHVDGLLDQEHDLRHIAPELEEALRERLRATIDSWRVREDRSVGSLLHATTERFGGQSETLMAETVKLAGEALGVELSARAIAAELPEASGFSYHFLRLPTVVESLVPDLRGYLPRRLARRVLQEDFRERIPPLVDKHCGRLRYDYVRRIDEARRALIRTLDDRLTTTQQTLGRALERSSEAQVAGSEQTDLRRARLHSDRDALVSLLERLGPHVAEVLRR